MTNRIEIHRRGAEFRLVVKESGGLPDYVFEAVIDTPDGLFDLAYEVLDALEEYFAPRDSDGEVLSRIKRARDILFGGESVG